MSKRYDVNTTGFQLVQDFARIIKNKIILVTGAAGGIGALYCSAVARASPALIVLAGRTQSSLEKAAQRITAAHPDVKTKTLVIDLANLTSVREAAKTLNSWTDVPRVDVLVNNASIMAGPYAKTVDGFESQFGTNHLGPFLFSNLIMDKILKSMSPRIVMVSSDGHRLSAIRWSDYNFSDGRTYEKWRGYGQSKTANCLMAISLARKLGGKGLVSFSLHPGVYFFSGLARDLQYVGAFDSLKIADEAIGVRQMHMELKSLNAEQIVATHIFASFTDELKEHNGAYLNESRLADQYNEEVYPWATDTIEADRLWTLSEELVGQKFEY